MVDKLACPGTKEEVTKEFWAQKSDLHRSFRPQGAEIPGLTGVSGLEDRSLRP